MSRDDFESTPEGSDGEYSLDPDDQLQPEDTLDNRDLDDVLDEGYSPPDREPKGAEYGLTAREQREGESLDQLLAEEEPDPATQISFHDDDEKPGDWESNEWDSDAEFPAAADAGDRRAGRLIAPDEGNSAADTQERVATDAGIDGAGASAEEAAVHVIDDEDDDEV